MEVNQNTPNVHLMEQIHLMHTTSDNAQRQQLQEQLAELEKSVEHDPVAHVASIVALMCTDMSGDSQQSDKKMALAVYLKAFSSKLTQQAETQIKKLSQFKNALDQSQLNAQLELCAPGFEALQRAVGQYVQCCLSNTCEQKFKSQIIFSVHKQLQVFQKLQPYSSQLFQTCLQSIVAEILRGLEQADNRETLMGAISLCDSIFSVLDQIQFEQAFGTIAHKLRGAADIQIASFKADMLNAQNQMPVAANDPIAIRLMSQLEVLHAWSGMFQKMIEKFENRSYVNFDVFIRSEDLASVMISLIALTANQGSALHQHSVISFSGLQKLDSILNQTKGKVIESINMLLEYALQIHESQQTQSPIINKMIQCVPQLILSTRSFASDPRQEELLDDEIYQELIVQLIETLSITSGDKKFSEIFMAEMPNIVIQICFNLIKFTKSEAERMLDDPQEYINYTLDCCDKQQSMVPKTQACKLIESMCDNIDGAVTFITNLACSATNLALQGPTAQVFGTAIMERQQEPFFLSDPILIADTCLIVFTVMSYILPQRKDLIGNFESMVSTNVNAFLEKRPHNLPEMDDFSNAKAVILLNRFSLLLGYYADILFTHDQDAFRQTMEFLIEGIGNTQGIDEVVARGCVDTIAIVVTDHDVAPRLKLYLDTIVGQLVKLLDTVVFVNFYEFMVDFIKLFAKDLCGDRILSLLNATVARILKEQQAKLAGNQTDQSSIVLDKCCTILRVCVDNHTYMGQMREQFEEALKPIFRFISEPEKITFEDDILLLLKSMIKKSKSVTPVMWEMFDHFPKILAKSKGQLGDLLDTLNSFMIYGKDQFAQRDASIRVYAQIIEQAMFTNKLLSDCEGAVACQLLFQSLAGTQSLDAVMEPILDLTTRRMQTEPMPFELKKHLIGIFMASMYYSAQPTLRYLENHGMTSKLVEEMCNLRTKFTAEYEKRFFIIGLSRMLMSPTLPPSLQPQLIRLLQELVETITSLHEQVTQRVKAQSEKEANMADSDDDSDEEDSSEESEQEDNPKKSSSAAQEAEETKGGMDDDQLGFVQKDGAAADDSDDDENILGSDARGNITDDSDNEDDTENFEWFDLKIVMECLKCPIKQEDETKVFKEVLQSLSARSPAEMNATIQQMSDLNKTRIRRLLSTANVEYEDDSGAKHAVARRIVRVVRRDNNAGGATQQIAAQQTPAQ